MNSKDCSGLESATHRAIREFQKVPEFSGRSLSFELDNTEADITVYVDPARVAAVPGRAGFISCDKERTTADIVLNDADWCNNAYTHELAHWFVGCGTDPMHSKWQERGIYAAITNTSALCSLVPGAPATSRTP